MASVDEFLVAHKAKLKAQDELRKQRMQNPSEQKDWADLLGEEIEKHPIAHPRLLRKK